MTVSNTVEGLGGQVKNIAPSIAEIELRNGLTKEYVIKAIEGAGYTVATINN